MKLKKSDKNDPGTTFGQDRSVADFDDIVFENRNREYGAYQLRKRYHRVLFAGLLICTLIVTTAVLIPFLLRPSSDKVITGGRGSVMIRMENLTPPEEQLFIPPAAPPPPQSEEVHEIVKYVPPVVVDSLLPSEITQMTTEEILSSIEGEIPEVTGTGFGDGLIDGPGGGDLEEPLFQVEVMPSFRGGDLAKFREWVGKRTNYPQAAIENKIRGTVYLTFIIEKDGSVSNVTIIKGVHPLLDNEAVKVISESPKWSPGLQRGQPVRVRFQIPLSFIY